MQDGLAAVSADRIAAEAEVARATFFRYFESKEYAVAEGFTARWIAAITDAVRRQPDQLSPPMRSWVRSTNSRRDSTRSTDRSPRSSARPASR